jgi:hypothetical protein
LAQGQSFYKGKKQAPGEQESEKILSRPAEWPGETSHRNKL